MLFVFFAKMDFKLKFVVALIVAEETFVVALKVVPLSDPIVPELAIRLLTATPS
jgi:hypothetical protein